MIVVVATTAFILVGLGMNGRAGAAPPGEAKKIFSQRCTACHSFGHGVKVGPDLKGVTQRRTAPWLLRFIRSSQAVIRSGDPVAGELFARFKQQRMPDWKDLSEAQISSLLAFLAENGPEQKEPDERSADLATAADIEQARRLFDGRLAFTNGGTACIACHALAGDGETKVDRAAASGGSWAPDLSDAYMRFRDRALTLFFKRPCSTRWPEATAAYLTPEESFALKAYLRQVALGPSKEDAP